MSYYSYENRGGFMSNVPVAVKNIIIINVLVMIMTALNENFIGGSLSHICLCTVGSGICSSICTRSGYSEAYWKESGEQRNSLYSIL